MIQFRNENENSAGNFNSVSINWVRFYFSYTTCVAISLRESYEWKTEYCIQNQRWPTTGKHLNWFDWWRKDERIKPDQFEKIYKIACKQIGLKQKK